MSADQHLDEEVRALAALDLEGLREVWRRRVGPPPPVRSPRMLRLCLAFRMQVAVHGALSADTRRRLRSAGVPAGLDHVTYGVKLVKTWRGERHEVLRTGSGYRWNGTDYTSLSAVATAMTGVKRNGPRFFGLREDEASR